MAPHPHPKPNDNDYDLTLIPVARNTPVFNGPGNTAGVNEQSASSTSGSNTDSNGSGNGSGSGTVIIVIIGVVLVVGLVGMVIALAKRVAKKRADMSIEEEEEEEKPKVKESDGDGDSVLGIGATRTRTGEVWKRDSTVTMSHYLGGLMSVPVTSPRRSHSRNSSWDSRVDGDVYGDKAQGQQREKSLFLSSLRNTGNYYRDGEKEEDDRRESETREQHSSGDRDRLEAPKPSVPPRSPRLVNGGGFV